VFVNLSSKENVVCKLTLENLSTPLSDDVQQKLREVGIEMQIQKEDDVTYLCFTLPERGRAA
jgi:hypothetical protein